jgi:hypothetical protein
VESEQQTTRTIELGALVYKKTGYLWPGVVVAVFDTLSGERRFVVECTVDEVAGALHIYSGDQLKLSTT